MSGRGVAAVALLTAVAASSVACAGEERSPPAVASSSVPASTPPPASAAASDDPSEAARVPANSPSSAAAAPGAPARRRYALAAIGDSFTDPRSHGGIYLKVLAERCPRSRFESFGVGGNMVNMMQRRFLRDVFGEGDEGGAPGAAAVGAGPDRPVWTHVVVLGGLGDALSNITAKRTAGAVQRDLGWMIAESRRRGAAAIVLSLPPWAGFRDYDGARAQMARDINAWIAAEARAGRIDATFDTRSALSCGNVERLCDTFASPDRLHWNEAGQRAVGEALHRALFADCE